jgi:hypothetical protein
VHCGHNVIIGLGIIIFHTATIAELLSAMRWVSWCRGATTHVGGELRLCKVDALDG